MSDFILTPPIKTMEDAFSVKGKNVVITGGNRGIGRGITTLCVLSLRDFQP